MNAKQALQETILIWESLARSGINEKEDAIEETGLLHALHYTSKCPLCAHRDSTQGGCSSCVVWGEKDYSCWFTGKGEYWLWAHAGGTKERKYCAKTIADMAREALDKLETEK